jgi:tetratricopeptide (TPR) repeat protein
VTLCGVDDEACYARAFGAACAARQATQATCTALAQQLVVRADANEPKALNYLAFALKAMADRSTIQVERSAFLAQAKAAASKLLAQHPDHAGGYFTMAILTDDVDEQVKLYARAVELSPSSAIARKQFAGILLKRGQSGDLVRAADQLERGYGLERQGQSRLKLELAASAVEANRLAGRPDRVVSIRSSVRANAGVDRLLDELMSGSRMSLARASENLELLCDESLIRIVGSEDCLSGVDNVGQRLANSSEPKTQSLAIAERIGDLMGLANISPSNAADKKSREIWRSQFRALLATIRSRGLGSARVDLAYANLVDDNILKLRSLERAVQLAPNDRVALVRLADTYRDTSRFDDAARTYSTLAQMTQGMTNEQTASYLRSVDEMLQLNETKRLQAAEQAK